MTRRTMARSAWFAFLVSCTTFNPVWAQGVTPPPDPGAVSNESRRNQQRLKRDTDPDISGPPVVGPAAPPTVVGPSGGPTFLLKKVVFEKSEFLSEAELNALAAPYIGRRVDNADLQRLLKSINDIYAARRQITAIAYLPKQDLKTGVLRIGIVEGRVGNVKVQGAKTITAETVRGAVTLTPGKVVDVPKLEDQVAWYNRGHLAQLQASLQPGASFGLTNIDLAILEPPKNLLQVFVDNQGVESVGQYQLGANFQHYGLLGIDDRFTFYGIGAHGNRNANFAYDVPITPWGGRAGVSYSTGSIAVYRGAYRDLDIKGRSQNAAINVSHPVFVNSSFAFLVNGALSRSNSASTQSDVEITDNVTRKETMGVTLNYTSDRFNVAFSPNFSFAHTKFRVVDTAQDFQLLNGSLSASARLPYDFVLTSFNVGQWANQKLLAGDQLIQIGGPTTVRGYPTSGVAGYAGYYGNVELHHNLNMLIDGLDAFAFLDHGAVFSTFPSSVYLMSVGAGLSYNPGKYWVADVSIGTPIRDEIPDRPNYFVYFRLTAKLSSAYLN